MDGNLRQNSNSKIDDEVYIEKINCLIAHAVTLHHQLRFPDLKRNDIISYIHDRIVNKNILEGNVVIIRGIKIFINEESRDLSLTVTKTLPKGAVKITANTKLTISEIETSKYG